MSSVARAIQLDCRKLERAAADEYEAVLREDGSSEAAINLWILYWQVAEYGYWATRELPRDFVHRAGRRSQELRKWVSETFPDNVEAQFWRDYTEWVDTGEPSLDERFRFFWEARRVCSIPLIYFWSMPGVDREQLRPWLEETYQMCRRQPTTKNRYVLSVIEAALVRYDNDG